ncbi:hypothetical protein GFPCMMHI_01145 [Ensifer adhaerens]|nr:hypothetical protein [Ensifer adhaerens]
MSRYKEVWVDGPNGESLCALINGDVGWLMYLRYEADAGFSSRSPDYVMMNGQQDWYPASWALPLSLLNQALDYFRSTGAMPPFVTWHNEDDDEAVP